MTSVMWHPNIKALILLVVIAFGSTWLIFRTAVIKLYDREPTWIVARVAPHSEAMIPRRALVSPVNRNEFRQLLMASARQKPLSARSLFEAAQLDLAEGNPIGAMEKLQSARVLDPRNVGVRLQLAALFVGSARPEGAIAELDAAMRVSPRLSPQLAPLLPAIATTQAAQDALRVAVGSQSAWRKAMIGRAEMATNAPGLLFSAIAANSTSDPAQRHRAEQSAFLRNLIDEGDYDTALLAFVNFLPDQVALSKSAIYDGSFDGLPGPPPFNWDITISRVDRATLTRDVGGGGVLRVEFYDDRPLRLASQFLMLPPGRYVLGTTASSVTGLAPETLGWQLECHVPGRGRRGRPLGRLGLDEIGVRVTTVSVPFEVPAENCPGQFIILAARPGPIPQIRRSDIHAITIESTP